MEGPGPGRELTRQKRNKENSHICVTTVTSSRLDTSGYTNNSSTLVVEIYVRLEDWYVCRVEVATGHQWLIIIFHFCCLLCWHLNLTPDYILRACICLCASCSLSSTSAKSARSRTRASSVLVSEATEAGQQYTRLFVCICWEMRRCFICAALEISMDRYLLER